MKSRDWVARCAATPIPPDVPDMFRNRASVHIVDPRTRADGLERMTWISPEVRRAVSGDIGAMAQPGHDRRSTADRNPADGAGTTTERTA